MLTLSACQTPSADPQEIPGAFLSIWLAETGPAVLWLPTPSVIVRESVPTAAPSPAPAALVGRSQPWSEAWIPEPPSVAVQWIVMSAPCHRPSADPQETTGALRSILLAPIGPAWVELPTTS